MVVTFIINFTKYIGRYIKEVAIFYRDNFFCRTQLTIPSVARTVIAAYLHEDMITVADKAHETQRAAAARYH